MPPQEQAELWMALRDRMTASWHELTMQEKKACELMLFIDRSGRYRLLLHILEPQAPFYIGFPLPHVKSPEMEAKVMMILII